MHFVISQIQARGREMLALDHVSLENNSINMQNGLSTKNKFLLFTRLVYCDLKIDN